MKYPDSFNSHLSGSCSSQVHSIKVEEMGSGKITNDEGFKTEALSGSKVSLGVHGSLLKSENFNLRYLFSPNITNRSGVGLVKANFTLIQTTKYCALYSAFAFIVLFALQRNPFLYSVNIYRPLSMFQALL